MKSFELCQTICPDLIPVKVGKRLGTGADGEVFEIEGSNDRVIKFSVLYDYPYATVDKEFDRIDSVLSFLEQTRPSVYTCVFSHGKLAERSRDNLVFGQQKYFLYFYIMEKCFKISEDEKRVFHTLISHEDRNIIKNFSINKLKSMLLGMSKGLDFDVEKVIFFCEELKRITLKHMDLHPRNVMKDSRGNFKLIDFDRAKLGD